MIDIERYRFTALKSTEAMARGFLSAAVVEDGADGQLGLRGRHRRRQSDRAPRLARQHWCRQQVAFAHEIAELADTRVRLQVGTLDIDMGNARLSRADH